MSGNPHSQSHRVTDLRYRKADKELDVTFEGGANFTLPAEMLRVLSPSAEVQGHSPAQRQVVAGRRHVGIIGIEPVGNYAVKIRFDDLHSSGIYTWDYLYDLGENREARWQGYLDELAEKGLSRDPR